MTRTIPAELALPALAKFAHPRDISAEDFEQLLQAGHHRYAREGARCHLLPVTGRGLTAPDRAVTSSTTYTQVNEAPGAELSQTQGVVRLTRVLGGVDETRLKIKLFGEDAQVRVLWEAVDDPGGWSGNVTLSPGASPEWVEGLITIPAPGELVGAVGPALRLLRLWAIFRRPGTPDATLYHLSIEDDQEVADGDLAFE